MRDYRIAESMEQIQLGRADALSPEELLSVFLGSREKAEKLLAPADDLFSGQTSRLSSLSKMDVDTLRYCGGLSQTTAIKMASMLELSKRILNSSAMDAAHITSPGDGAKYLERLRYYQTEVFVVLLLSTKNRVIKAVKIAAGSLTSAVVHPREVFAPAVAAHCASILVAHNHPSGDPYPSSEDRNLTRALEAAGNVLGIPVIDHLVIGDGRYFSFKEHGEL